MLLKVAIVEMQKTARFALHCQNAVIHTCVHTFLKKTLITPRSEFRGEEDKSRYVTFQLFLVTEYISPNRQPNLP